MSLLLISHARHAALSIAAGLLLLSVAAAGPVDVLPEGELPADARLGPLKDLNGYFPFTPSETPEAWSARAADVRRRILVANGLWPMPERTPPNAVVHGKVDRDTYTVQRVYLESYPGHFVTGNLYRPKGREGKLPAVLSPHGHFANGRFHDAGVEKAREQIVAGAERFENSGRSPLQARCMQLARMGCVVFHYDMLGYADSVQIPSSLAHGFSEQRPEFDTPENWGFFSTQAELRLQNVMGLQTYNSLRALDWLSELPEVDPARIAVTGASGGGTQTFILAAIDERPAAVFPAVMVSTAMQGGCTCENCCHLRVGTGNVEFAALTAPRPLGMTGADDWTKELAEKGLPQLKAHYAMLGVPDAVMGKVLPQFGHNYNFVSREVMYQFMNKHLGLGLPEPVIEEDFALLSVPEMTVWDENHPRPPDGPDYERSLVKHLTDVSKQQIAALTPSDAASLERFRQVVGGGWDVLLGRDLPPAETLEFEQKGEATEPAGQVTFGLLRDKGRGEELPIVILHPTAEWNKRVVIWVDEQGKAALWGGDGNLAPGVAQLLAAGSAVVGADLLFQGEFLADGKPLEQTRRVDNPRQFAGYTWGYNPTLFANRTGDVLTLVSYFQNYRDEKPRVDLLATGAAGAWAAAARAQAREAVSRAAIDTGGFRFGKLTSIGDVNFIPGAVKYCDVPGLLALAAPGELWLADESPMTPGLVSAAYTASGAGGMLHAHNGPAEGRIAEAAKWLARP
ncbi:MAG: acetylxylan esterase [Planctomycetota bacterium]|nr:MAG: acetylxylan esterase [Planctomycetota bacterium]